ncbi:NAD-binding protein [Ignisphaera sp. 4213-co]|uniref:NAD-binding protein n=1 Tax=Ignisphaera cupida TaxID=3050454 RepID=A0ABD4Z8F4_9CREN|nr:NAD-binding protein [Ignisphaera sp. 4213-co]MDK6029175.1 NAD-binding protein [Ignisphaera sp. 4213-co]
MKVFIALSKKYVRPILSVVYMLKPKPKVTVVSDDEEVEVLSKYYGYEFKQFNNVEQLAAMQELREYDIAILAMDEDSKNVSIIKAVKQYSIPIIVTILHNSNNREIFISEGATYIINADEFLYSNIHALIHPDTWVVSAPFSALPKLEIAVYRVLRRALFNIPISEILEKVKEYGSDVTLYCFNRFGNKVSENSILSTGDYIVLIGVAESLEKTVREVEKLFRKYEEVYARRYLETIRLKEYG